MTAGLSSLGLFSAAEEGLPKSAKSFFVACAIAMYIFFGSFCFFLVRDITPPKSLSEDQKREIEDVACAVCAVLNNAAPIDPAISADLAEAKASLRRRMGKYRASQKAEVERQVQAYLRAQLFLQRDLRAFLQYATDSDRRFVVSAETREAFASLPTRMRVSTDAEIETVEDSITEAFGAKRGQRHEALAGVDTEVERQWRVMREVYEDLLNGPLPSREELMGWRGSLIQ